MEGFGNRPPVARQVQPMQFGQGLGNRALLVVAAAEPDRSFGGEKTMTALVTEQLVIGYGKKIAPQGAVDSQLIFRPLDSGEGHPQGFDLLAFAKGPAADQKVGHMTRFEGPQVVRGEVAAETLVTAKKQTNVARFNGAIAAIPQVDAVAAFPQQPVEEGRHRIRVTRLDGAGGDPAGAGIAEGMRHRQGDE